MSTVLEKGNVVTKPGVHFVPTKEDLKKIRFLIPNSDRLVTVEKQKTARRAPSRIQFGMLRNRRLRMQKAIPVEIERKGKTVVAKWAEIDEFGYGKNISEALEDFGRTIEELYLSLSESQAQLGSDLLGVWQVLSRHIEIRPVYK